MRERARERGREGGRETDSQGGAPPLDTGREGPQAEHSVSELIQRPSAGRRAGAAAPLAPGPAASLLPRRLGQHRLMKSRLGGPAPSKTRLPPPPRARRRRRVTGCRRWLRRRREARRRTELALAAAHSIEGRSAIYRSEQGRPATDAMNSRPCSSR